MENERESSASVSAAEAVCELLEDLLTVACTRDEKWDIASRRVPSSFASSSSSPPPCLVDVCDIVRSKMPAHIITGYCERQTQLEVLHLKCVDQKASGYCGHYAFYFALCCLEMGRCGSVSDAVALLEQIGSVASFWRRYWMSIEALLCRAREQANSVWWPWTEQHVLKGEMERSYLSHLLTSDPHVRALDGADQIVVLHFAYGCVQNSVDDIIRIQQHIDAFCSSPAPSSIMFILGVTNHWVALYAYHSAERNAASSCAPWDKKGESQRLERGEEGGEVKWRAVDGMRREGENLLNMAASDEGGSVSPGVCSGVVRVVYMDSNNVPVLQAGDDEIETIVREKEEERVKRKGKGYSDWKRGVIFQAFRDQRDLVSLLCSCLTGLQGLPSHTLGCSWLRVLDSFQKHVVEPAGEGGDRELFLALLLQWLECQHRPQSLRDTQVDMLRQLGSHQLPGPVSSRLADWLGCCYDGLSGYEGGILLVDQFISSVLDQLASMLNQAD